MLLKALFNKVFKRKLPTLIIKSEGVNEKGQLKLEMEWNNAFIEHIRSLGFVGTNEEESVTMFVMSFTNHPGALAEEGPVNPVAHPFLNAESGNQVIR